ncbi:SMI1/KNR4 family protein [Roseateles chitinivorans]|uniref:SMI1/KNR4 family protein n=1 Tax=Roseateles chitinivorans TaxID=2917965 RepID=UPI003D66FC7A
MSDVPDDTPLTDDDWAEFVIALRQSQGPGPYPPATREELDQAKADLQATLERRRAEAPARELAWNAKALARQMADELAERARAEAHAARWASFQWRIEFPWKDQYPEITLEDIRAFEARNQLELPPDYAAFLLDHRGSPPMMRNQFGGWAAIAMPVDWGGRPASSYGDEAELNSTYSLFEEKGTDSPYRSGCNLDDNLLWNEHLHPPGLLPIGGDPGNSQFMLGLEGERRGKVYFLSTFHIPHPMSHDHLGFVADSFTDFLAAARPIDRD